ncbi:ABC transporter substrate-binding protein, partial [bacterium]|nr:ABC transporter substrate-binding protein [bacterium]
MAKFLCLLFLPALAQAADVTLLLNWKPEAEFGGFYAAELSGAFAKEGLKVTIQPGGVGTPASQMVAAGKADFGVSSADAIIISQDRGTDNVALFAVYQTYPQGFLARVERGSKTMQEVLSTGILAVEAGHPFFQFLKKKFGVKAQVVPYLGGISQISQNPKVAQQCFIASEPILLEEKGMKGKTFL